MHRYSISILGGNYGVVEFFFKKKLFFFRFWPFGSGLSNIPEEEASKLDVEEEEDYNDLEK